LGILGKWIAGLTKTRQNFSAMVSAVLTGRRLDDDLFDELEETLILGDVGVEVAQDLISELKQRAKKEKWSEGDEVYQGLKELVLARLGEAKALNIEPGRMNVILVVGVNGVGKTTTIGKLAARFHQEGKKVLLVAADTFRAAAADQLEIWGQRAGVPVVRHEEGGDPAAVVFDGLKAAIARKSDVVLIDTAGRLHTKQNLMNELAKLQRVIGREIPGAPQEVLLVLDATTGQNALSQVQIFGEAVEVTGLALTKLDGTAKGGIVVGIASTRHVPVKLVGIGETVEDLRDFEPQMFVDALFEREDSEGPTS
jgi:fused signal recognition particle receptor